MRETEAKTSSQTSPSPGVRYAYNWSPSLALCHLAAFLHVSFCSFSMACLYYNLLEVVEMRPGYSQDRGSWASCTGLRHVPDAGCGEASLSPLPVPWREDHPGGQDPAMVLVTPLPCDLQD